MGRPLRTGLLLMLTVAAAAASWFGWMGWDTEYDVDPVTGYVSGPYEPWQVVGSGLCVVALVAVATWVLRMPRALLVAAAAAAGYCAAWSWTSLPQDETGLALVGAVMVLVGVGMGSTVVAAVVDAVAGRRRKPRANTA